MKWTRTPLANRFRYTSGEYTIDGIQIRFGSRTFYVVKKNGVKIDTCDNLAEAKEACDLDAECSAMCDHLNISHATSSDCQSVCWHNR